LHRPPLVDLGRNLRRIGRAALAALLCHNPLPRDFAMFLDFTGPPRWGDEDHALVS